MYGSVIYSGLGSDLEHNLFVSETQALSTEIEWQVLRGRAVERAVSSTSALVSRGGDTIEMKSSSSNF